MNLFEDAPNYIGFLKNLNNKTATIIDKLKSSGVNENDFRRTKLGGFNILTLATILDIQDYDTDIRYSDSRIPKMVSHGNPHLTDQSLLAIVQNIDIRNRISYLTISLFQFENLFVTLAKEIGFTGRETYYYSAKHLIDNLDLKEKPEKFDALILPSILRNTLHSSGIYYGYKKRDAEFKVKNISFKFEHGKPHTNSSWREIIFCFDNVVDVIEEILEKLPPKPTV